MKRLLTGNEAFARAAYEAGVSFASAYPGTPSTEILENITLYKEIVSEWAPNEKVALEACCGASIGGVRSLASMKHVGVNVAADPLFTFSYTGVNGGMVLISADEPGQHSSQNEQDNRYYALSAKLPMLEPANSNECKDMLIAAYDLSEEYNTPVLVRATTRVCHSKSIVECFDRKEVKPKEYKKDVTKYIIVPAMAKGLRVRVEHRMNRLKEYTEKSPFNFIEKGNGNIGIITSGMCYHYAREVFGEEANYLKLGFTNPLPTELLHEFYKLVDKVYIIEENDPYIEEWVKACGYKCHGKDTFPAFGEMTPDVIRKSVFGKEFDVISYNRELVVPRPPVLCAGCPHRGLFYELAKKKNTIISGDIGCYTLAFSDPYNAMDITICMGAAFSAGHGVQKAMDISKRDTRVVSVMGDSTFFHTGINSLIEVLYNDSKTICIILDNRITAMTGHQENPSTGKNASGKRALEMDIEKVVRSLGAKNVYVINPNDLKEVRETLNEAYKKDEPSVIITRWPCALKKLSIEEKEEFGEKIFNKKYEVDPEKCIACKACIRSGCPAISIDLNINKSTIDYTQCVGCSVCAQICPKNAINEARK